MLVLRIDSGEVRKADGAETVVQGHEHDVAIAAEVLAVIAVLLDTVAGGEAATVDPEQDRTLAGIRSRRPDVQAEAVLADIVIIPVVGKDAVVIAVLAFHPLRRGVAIIDSRKDIVPRFRGLRTHKAILTRGRRTVRDAEEGVDVPHDIAADLAILGRNYGDILADVQLLRIRIDAVRIDRRIFAGVQAPQKDGDESQKESDSFHKQVHCWFVLVQR